MIHLIMTLTLRQILGQRRTLFILLLAAVPVLVAVVFRIASPADEDPREFAADGLMASFIVHLVLPLTALIFGTAALGQEIEDGTAVYLLSKPMPRWKIIAGKLLASWAATAAVVAASIVLTGLVVLTGETQHFIIPAFAVAVVLGALAYSALFLCLSILFARALIIGLVYVFVWEAIFSQFAPGTQLLSVREYTLAVADALADAPAIVFEADLGPAEAILLLAALTVATTWYAIRSLGSLELTERA